MIPIISKEKQWLKPDSGVILSSFFWGYTLTQVASGYISDKIGGQKVLWISALGWSMTTYFMPEIIEFFSKSDTSVLLVATVRTINGAFQGNFIRLINSMMRNIRRMFIFHIHECYILQECISLV